MAGFYVAALLFILPAVLSAPPSEDGARQLGSSSVGSGAFGANYQQQNAAQENHDKKNFALNFGSDKGSSTQVSSTGLQAGASGGVASNQGFPVGYNQYPQPYTGVQTPYPGVVGHGAPQVGQGIHGGVQPYSAYPYQQPYYYPYPYPQYQYPVQYPGYPPVGQVPNVGTGSRVTVPGVSAGSNAGVGPQGISAY